MRTKTFKSLSKLLISAAICSVIGLGASTASALSISAEFNLPNTSVALPFDVISPSQINGFLTPGDILVFDIVVENASADTLTAIFATLVYDTAEFTFLGGAYSNILTEASCTGFLCSPATMTNLAPAPTSKPNSPLSLVTGTTDWIQAVAHTNIDGTMGQGPDSAALIAFQYIGFSGGSNFSFTTTLTAGDAIAGAVGPIAFVDGFVGMPEPGTALLVGLGLFGLGAAGRRRPWPRPRHWSDFSIPKAT